MRMHATRPFHHPLPLVCVATAILAVALLIGIGSGAPAGAQDLEAELDSKQTELAGAKQQKGVLTAEIEQYSTRISTLQAEVATLRNREAIVLEHLRRTEAELSAEVTHLNDLRQRLGSSLKILRDRLVAIYKSGEPDALTVILDSRGFDDLVSRYEYLDRIQDQDSTIVDRVRGLRDESLDTVQRIRVARDEIEARKAELAETRRRLEVEEAELASVRDQKASALASVGEHIEHLEGDISDISAKIEAQIAAAGASTTTTDPLPAGPIQGAGSGFIWPVNGTVVSPFGWRWGRMHEGIDIAVVAGTPIRAVKDGRILFVQNEYESGGYGNYTCIDHGGGLSTCSAHQSSFLITSGSVTQGDVIGYVGCTGHCFGDHLHFEVRINGSAVDPMGYL